MKEQIKEEAKHLPQDIKDFVAVVSILGVRGFIETLRSSEGPHAFVESESATDYPFPAAA
ncbi:MAG: hypothetical protein WD877_01135 [Candidatus Saccharimonadales bacterium]